MTDLLLKLKESDNYRKLQSCTPLMQKYIIFDEKQYLNLSSNDYLSLGSVENQTEFFDKCDLSKSFIMSNPSSRLMTGNNVEYDILEHKLAKLFKKERAIVLSSGFMINSGILAALSIGRTLIVADKLVHASIIDGIKLSGSDFDRFKHNNTEHLESILKKNKDKYENIYVVVESIYSMDGDISPLKEIVSLKNKYDFKLYVDEAHAFGVRGETGCGISEELNIMSEIDILVATLGKSLSSQGGFVVCNDTIAEVLVNRMRTLIFSTALPTISLMWSSFCLDKMVNMSKDRIHLRKISNSLSNIILNRDSESHIIPIMVGNNEQSIAISNKLKDYGYWVTAIRHPTVPINSARIRISLNSMLDDNEVIKFGNILNSII